MQPLPAWQRRPCRLGVILLPRQLHAGGAHCYAIGADPLTQPCGPKPSPLEPRRQHQQQRRFPLAEGTAVITAIDGLHQQRLQQRQTRGTRGPPPTSRSRGGTAGDLRLPMPSLQCGCGKTAAQACLHRKCCRCCPGTGCRRHAATSWPR